MFEEDSQRKDKEMYDLKHDLIEAQIQLETLKKEKEQLEKEREQLMEQNKRLEEDMDSLLNK